MGVCRALVGGTVEMGVEGGARYWWEFRWVFCYSAFRKGSQPAIAKGKRPLIGVAADTEFNRSAAGWLWWRSSCGLKATFFVGGGTTPILRRPNPLKNLTDLTTDVRRRRSDFHFNFGFINKFAVELFLAFFFLKIVQIFIFWIIFDVTLLTKKASTLIDCGVNICYKITSPLPDQIDPSH